MQRQVIVNNTTYILTYDEYDVLDTVVVKGDTEPLSTENKVVQKLVKNAGKIMYYLPVSGVKYGY